MPAPGCLFVVATPIGNLDDLTFRALRTLRDVALVAAEDTRHTAKLLHHYGVRTPTISLHDHNEASRAPALVERMLGGASVALVSDAGTPGVSDPGFKLIQAAIRAGLRVESIPGPSALLAALVSSGLPTDAFVFAGFPPPKPRAREAWLLALAADPRTVVFFEAPHRIRGTLEQARAVLGDREVSVARELTKLHEEVLRGRLSDVLSRLTAPRGEFTVVMAGAAETVAAEAAQPADNQVLAAFDEHVSSGCTRREAIAAVARRFGLRTRDTYAAVERARHS